jgi:hypothetical protein
MTSRPRCDARSHHRSPRGRGESFRYRKSGRTDRGRPPRAADALEIEAGAKRRLADEYDAAQERGEVRTRGRDRTSKLSDEKFGPRDIGLDDKSMKRA